MRHPGIEAIPPTRADITNAINIAGETLSFLTENASLLLQHRAMGVPKMSELSRLS